MIKRPFRKAFDLLGLADKYLQLFGILRTTNSLFDFVFTS